MDSKQVEHQQAVLDVKALKLELDGRLLLDNVSFSVEKGDYISIVGPNGAGKSTLLKCLTMLHDSWSGNVCLWGRNIREYSRRELARLIGYVPQKISGTFTFTVHEFLEIGRYAWHSLLNDGRDGSIIENAMKLTGIQNLRDRRMDTLSGGEAQKVLLASAIAQQAELIFLDEPTTYLDPRYQNEVNVLIARLNKEFGITIVSVTHDLNSAAMYAKRIIALKDGSVAFNLLPQDFTDNDILQKIFGISFPIVKHPVSGKNAILI